MAVGLLVLRHRVGYSETAQIIWMRRHNSQVLSADVETSGHGSMYQSNRFFSKRLSSEDPLKVHQVLS